MHQHNNDQAQSDDYSCGPLYYRLRRITQEADDASVLRREVRQRLEAAIAIADECAHRKQWSAAVDFLTPQDYTHADKDENVLRGAAKVLFKKLKDSHSCLRVYLDFVRKPDALVPTLAIFLDWSHSDDSLLDQKLFDQHYGDDQDYSDWDRWRG